MQTKSSRVTNKRVFAPKHIMPNQITLNGIKLKAKPLGQPSSKAVVVILIPLECNPIEGRFGRAKIGYRLNNLIAILKETSESWIASIG